MAEKKKTSGCCVFGCVGVALMFAVAVIALGLGAKWGFRKLMAWTDAAPMAITEPSLPPEQFESLTNRVRAFVQAVTAGEDAQTLMLNANELNVLMTNLPPGDLITRRFGVTIVSNNIYGAAALPLDNIPGPLKGRYMNFTARIEPVVEEGQLSVRIQDIQIHGKTPPSAVTSEIMKQDLTANLKKSGEAGSFLRNLGSIAVSNNLVIVTSGGTNAPPAPSAR